MGCSRDTVGCNVLRDILLDLDPYSPSTKPGKRSKCFIGSKVASLLGCFVLPHLSQGEYTVLNNRQCHLFYSWGSVLFAILIIFSIIFYLQFDLCLFPSDDFEICSVLVCCTAGMPNWIFRHRHLWHLGSLFSIKAHQEIPNGWALFVYKVFNNK